MKTREELAKEYVKYNEQTQRANINLFLAGWDAAMTQVAQEIANNNPELIRIIKDMQYED